MTEHFVGGNKPQTCACVHGDENIVAKTVVLETARF